MNTLSFAVTETRCTGCGACSSLAPGVFVIRERTCSVARQPNEQELSSCEAALLNCPAYAIRSHVQERPPQDQTPSTNDDVYPSLIRESEGVRWLLSEIPWEKLDPNSAPPALRALVREMAFYEQTTYSATGRFMQAFYDDIDFSQWLAVWFYEETRHPHALITWLRNLGETVEDSFVLRGRVSTPFMKSLTGTLVTNVISEVTASHAYQRLSILTAEPALKAISQKLSGDEARHAAGFFLFARKRLARSQNPARERIDGLKVLHMWLNGSDNVTHPINQLLQRLSRGDDGANAKTEIKFDLDNVRLRLTRLVGILLGLPLRQPQDVLPQLEALISNNQLSK
jgi:ferredoxin